MEYSKLLDNMEHLSKKLELIQDYISYKFGSDFKEFCGIRGQDCLWNDVPCKCNCHYSSVATVENQAHDQIQVQNQNSLPSVEQIFLAPTKVEVESLDIEIDNDEQLNNINDFNLGNYSIDESESDDSQTSETCAKKRRPNYEYRTVNTFTKVEEAKEYVSNLGQWRCNGEKLGAEGRKIIYLCKFTRNCPARMQIFIPPHQTTCELQKSSDEHQHQIQVQKKKLPGIPKATKEEIKKLIEIGVDKPKKILQNLTSKNIPLPTRLQLQNFLQKWRYKGRNSKISMGQNELESDSFQGTIYSN